MISCQSFCYSLCISINEFYFVTGCWKCKCIGGWYVVHSISIFTEIRLLVISCLADPLEYDPNYWVDIEAWLHCYLNLKFSIISINECYFKSIMDFKIKASDFCMDSWTFKSANSFATSRAAGPWKISTNRTVLSGGISRLANLDITKIGLFFLFQSLFLNHFSEIYISFQLAFLLDSFDDPFLVFEFASFAIFFKHIMIIKFCHFIWILIKIILQIHQFLLSDGFSLIGIDFPPSWKSISPHPMSGFDCTWHNTLRLM